MSETEAELELQALEAIFMNDLQISPQRDSFKLQVFPSFGGAFKNHLAVELSASFPPDYPNSPLSNIALKVITGGMMDESLEYLKSIVVNESTSEALVGQLMVFPIIEKLKEHLALYNEDLTEGSFILLSNEIMVNIFSYLSPIELGQIARVNKTIKAISEDTRLWKQIFLEEPKLTKHVARLEAQDTEPFWKREYIEWMDLAVPELNYVTSIYQRKDTGDEWLLHLEHVADWRDMFKQALSQNFELETTGNVSGRILWKTDRIGYYRFVDDYKPRDPYEEMCWKNIYDQYLKDCPYITGKPMGYFRFWVRRKVAHVLAAVISTSRGVLARLDKEPSYIPCIRLQWTRVVNLVGKGEEDVFKEMGFIVHPRKTRKRVKYLNDIVDALNISLMPLTPKVKAGATVKTAYKPVPHNTGQKLYPFTLDVDQLSVTYQSRIGDPSISLWILNVAEIYRIAGTEFFD